MFNTPELVISQNVVQLSALNKPEHIIICMFSNPELVISHPN